MAALVESTPGINSLTMRLHVTQRADLAVRALIALDLGASRQKGVDLAEVLDSTPALIPQVMTPLVRAGWARSIPGPTGGYELQVALADLTVLQVIEQIDGPTDSGRCVVDDRPCAEVGTCTLHTSWSTARTQLTSSLQSISLAEAADRP